MPVLSIDAIRGNSSINGRQYPMYCGFMSSRQLRTIAEVPSFPRDKPHHRIASDISNPPVDEWQRPLNDDKTMRIMETYSRPDKDNLMANPVLLGVALPLINHLVAVTVTQKTIRGDGGTITEVANVYEVAIRYTQEAKPLWILDGQHRIEGMYRSTQSEQPIPFVLLYHETAYTPPRLAEIFTQVTTGATPMEPLHAEWMKYAFRLDRYSELSYQHALEATIHLCKEVQLGAVSNPFNNKIRFNPYLPPVGYFAFAFDMREWADMIAERCFGRGCALSPHEVAAEIAKCIRAMESLDQYRGQGGSKLFSNDAPHKILAEGFVSAVLRRLALDSRMRSFDEWVVELRNISMHRCNWRLPFVRTTGALSSANGKPSKTVALDCFDVALNDPGQLGTTLLSDYLYGVGAAIRVTAYQRTPTGRLSNRGALERSVPTGIGVVPFDLNEGDTRREIIRIEPDTPNCYVLQVVDPNHNPHRVLSLATTRTGLDVSAFPPSYEIRVVTMSYSGDTRKETPIRLDR